MILPIEENLLRHGMTDSDLDQSEADDVDILRLIASVCAQVLFSLNSNCSG